MTEDTSVRPAIYQVRSLEQARFDDADTTEPFGYCGDTVVLSVRNQKSPEPNGCKVIDKFNISYQRASDIIKVVLNHGNMNQLGSLNQEEKYFAYVIRS